MSATRVVFNPRNCGEFIACEPRLYEILSYVALIYPDEDLVIGDIHRTEAEELAASGRSGIHVAGPPYRALDVKVSGATIDARWAKAEALAEKVNERYIYDPTRPGKVCAFAQPHGTGPHIHLQVHAATRRTKDSRADV